MASTATWLSNWIVEVVTSTGMIRPVLVRCRPSQLSVPSWSCRRSRSWKPAANSGTSIWLVVIPSNSSRRITELAACGGIGVEDPPFLIVHEDRVMDSIEQGPGAALRLDQRGLGLLSLGDVLKHAAQARDPTILVPVLAFLNLGDQFAPVSCQQDLLVGNQGPGTGQLLSEALAGEGSFGQAR